ncbi:MAG: hypothetical protein AAB706_04325 [Patescibacteria group bacterium]
MKTLSTDAGMEKMNIRDSEEQLKKLIVEYEITITLAEHSRLRGEEKVRAGILLLKESDSQYEIANEIRSKISKLT